MTTAKDSKQETFEHIFLVRELLLAIQNKLEARGAVHDASKLQEPEKSGFDEVTEKLSRIDYGSPEYKAALAELKPTLDHHYACNSHHPEHFKLWKCPICKSIFKDSEAAPAEVFESKPRFCPKCCPQGSLFEATLEPHVGVEGMTLLDVVEMLADWKAATARMKNGGDIRRSIEINTTRFSLTPQLQDILLNTVDEMGW